ncbi:MAG TPA: hypothetical protein VKW04_18275 [Planctomycetota bacterium]|nr:hypothetical protein [Planctomycetota bacterium]
MIPDLGAFQNMVGQAMAAKEAAEKRDAELAAAIKRVEDLLLDLKPKVERIFTLLES